MSEQARDDHASLGPESRYKKRLAEGIFEIQCCNICAKHQFYPRTACRYCGSVDFRWVAPSGQAKVYSTTVVRRKTTEGGDYNVAIVTLSEGPRMMSRVEGIAPDQVRIGMDVRARIKGHHEEVVLVFTPDVGRSAYEQ